MTNTRNIKGIIYKINNSNSFDKVITLIDSNGSKVILLAKGIRKVNSKKAHSIELINYVKCSVIDNYNVAILSEISVIDEFNYLKHDYKSIILAQFLCEVLNYFTFENNDLELYKLLLDLLKSNNANNILVLSSFLLKLLKLTGNLPELNIYLDNEEDVLNGEAYLLDSNIGYYSKLSDNGFNKVDPLIYKLQKFFLNNNFKSILKLKNDNELSKKILFLHIQWIENVIEKKLKSREILLNTL